MFKFQSNMYSLCSRVGYNSLETATFKSTEKTLSSEKPLTYISTDVDTGKSRLCTVFSQMLCIMLRRVKISFVHYHPINCWTPIVFKFCSNFCETRPGEYRRNRRESFANPIRLRWQDYQGDWICKESVRFGGSESNLLEIRSRSLSAGSVPGNTSSSTAPSWPAKRVRERERERERESEAVVAERGWLGSD